MATSEYWMKSRPIRVHFQGWESDTCRLQANGWDFSVEQVPSYSFGYRFLLSNRELRLAGVSDVWNEDPIRYMTPGINKLQVINMNWVASTMNTHVRYEGGMYNGNIYKPYMEAKLIDMTPTYVEANMSELFPFNVKDNNAPEVIMESTADMEVIDYLEAVLDKQKDKQAEIRAKKRRRVNDIEVDMSETKFKLIV